ncbi:isoleucine--tRNA ligase [bacterium]|nr:isoleucine--tRNA ligase [bacterium]
MKKPFAEYSELDLVRIHREMLEQWNVESCFARSLELRKDAPSFVFYEGPPSANGMPGIHHVLSRSIKDLFCRYQTQKGRRVARKAGWDTHGLPVELGVEKELGITKEDIGKTLGIAEYNAACREAVMRFTGPWNDLTQRIGYWVDLEDPYITYKSKYIESVWWLLSQFHERGLLYKGYTIQPYSPKAGTGLSSHELNQPGCYRDVTDTTATAQFRLLETQAKIQHFGSDPVYALAWTTTPWTLPANTALAVGQSIEYSLIETYNPYVGGRIRVVLATAALGRYFKPEAKNLKDVHFEPGDKLLPWSVLSTFRGSDLAGLAYEPLFDWIRPLHEADKAYRIIEGDYVSTEDGTGMVHIAPTFGADDARVAKQAGIPPMLVADAEGQAVPIVDLQGRYQPTLGRWAGRYVKNEYYEESTAPERSLDVDISIDLKERGLAFKVEKYVHSYPHCWRTDKPVLYYPLDSWFIQASEKKSDLLDYNTQILWKPKSTGEGRFANWLSNLNDWNLSRSRFWGIPLPIWSTEDGSETRVFGSVEELQQSCSEAVAAGLMPTNPLGNFRAGDMSEANYDAIDLHRPFVDEIVLKSPLGKPMRRETDLIDVWFDSGSMPYAQWHYPFENQDIFKENFPADLIAEGVDQTRGWFYTLHAIAGMLFESPAYKTVVSNGLVLDKNGQKMSKRLGNAVDPFATLDRYGADALRWYMLTNAQPWENLRFDEDGMAEVQRKFFGTLHHTYAFFALYANIDGYEPGQPLPEQALTELDRWILSELNQLLLDVDTALSEYEPTRAGRAIQEFAIDKLSNWYVRLSRRRFWKDGTGADKLAAFGCLHRCLETVARLSAPFAPFYADRLYRDLVRSEDSVHWSDFPTVEAHRIDADLMWRMRRAQQVVSIALGIRKKEKIRVRQPLPRLAMPVLNPNERSEMERVAELIRSEINVKTVEFLDEQSGLIVKKAKPNFKRLGPRIGPRMKALSDAIAALDAAQIAAFERANGLVLPLEGGDFALESEDLELFAQDVPGWQVGSENGLTVALDLRLSPELIAEGLSRELINRVQNLRKDRGLEITDRIALSVQAAPEAQAAFAQFESLIRAEVLAVEIRMDGPVIEPVAEVDVEGWTVRLGLEKRA